MKRNLVLLIILIALGLLFFTFADTTLASKTDNSKEKRKVLIQVEKSKVESVQEIIKERLKFLGIRDFSVFIKENTKNKIVIKVFNTKRFDEKLELLFAQDGILRIENHEKEVILTEKDVIKAKAKSEERFKKPSVTLYFNDLFAVWFANFTENNLGRKLKIYVDGNLISEPVIQAKIDNGKALITGMKNIKEAKKLAMIWSTRVLPSELKVLKIK